MKPCTLEELLPINQAIKVASWFDVRPLTDETLEELGFFKPDKNWYYHIWHEKKSYISLVTSKNNEFYEVTLDRSKTKPKWTTVGGVKLLLEALKGEIK